MSKENQKTKIFNSGGREGNRRDFPSERPKELSELLQNFNLDDSKISQEGEALFYLSNNRSFQQSEEMKELIRQLKLEMRGKQFRIANQPPRYCRNQPLAILRYKDGKLKNVTMTKTRCKSRTCPYCYPIENRLLRKLLQEVIILNDMHYFLTLTIDPKLIPEEYLSSTVNRTHEFITDKFNHFVVTLKRKKYSYFDEKLKKFVVFELKKQEIVLKFVWVMEFQKNGNAHLHVVLNKFLPIKLVWDIWSHIGVGNGGYIEKIRNIKAISVYLTDYLTKSMNQDLRGKSFFKYFERRFSMSRNCIRPAKNMKHFLEGLDYKNMTLEERNDALKLYDLDWIYEYMYNPNYKEQSLLFKATQNHQKEE